MGRLRTTEYKGKVSQQVLRETAFTNQSVI